MSRASITMGGFELDLGEKSKKSKTSRDDSFNLLILGNFSGVQGSSAIDRPRIMEIDRDNFDSLLETIHPHVRIPLASSEGLSQDLRFTCLEDFEPDAIFHSAEVFQHLRDLRARLQDPSSFAEAAAELGFQDKPADEALDIPAADILDSVIDTTAQSLDVQNDLEAYVKKIVAPYAVPKAHPKTDELVALVDSAIAEQMRQILHHPKFKALESAWRGMDMLIRRLDSNNRLRLKIVDLNKQSLSDDINASDKLETTGLYKFLVTSNTVPGSQPPSLIIGLYEFDRSIEDMINLARIGTISRAAGTSFIGQASTRFVHEGHLLDTYDSDDWACDWSEDEKAAWGYMLSIPEAQHIALTMPRFLMRLPYGRLTSPVESFAFEEIGDDFESENFLWGNTAILAALIYGQAFETQDWDLQLTPMEEVKGLPVFTYEDEYGEMENLSCAETIMNERGGKKIRELGMSTLWWVKNTDEVRLGLHSLTGTKLAGPWN
jgi:type VI secretion system protein ImpC